MINYHVLPAASGSKPVDHVGDVTCWCEPRVDGDKAYHQSRSELWDQIDTFNRLPRRYFHFGARNDEISRLRRFLAQQTGRTRVYKSSFGGAWIVEFPCGPIVGYDRHSQAMLYADRHVCTSKCEVQ